MNLKCFDGKQPIYINLDNVSHIKIDEANDRIYFNMNYAIQHSDGMYIQDYIYVPISTENLLKLGELDKSFIKYEHNRYVNIHAISSFKYDESHERIIVNLNTPHTYTISGKSKVLAEFIYVNEVTQIKFEEFVKALEV